MSKLTIKVHEASPRKYRQHLSQRIGVVNDVSSFIARKRELDARAEAWRTCLDRGECLHEQGFCNTLSGMLDDALSKIPHSDFAGVRIELDPDSDGLPCIWWGWVYDGNGYRIAPDKWVAVETGAGSFWQKAMQAMIDKTIQLSPAADSIIARVFAEGDSEAIEYGIKFDEDGMSRYLVQCGYPSIKESAKLITAEIVPVWEKLVKASVIADKELVREFKQSNTAKSKQSEKRTVTTSYDVYTYDELSDEAKKTVKDMFLQWRGEDGSIFTEGCETTLAELFPNSDLKVQYSLSYSQGDGFNTSGTLTVGDLLNVDMSEYPLNNSDIKPLSDKDAIKTACEDAGISKIKLPVNRRYGYSMADSIELETDSGYSVADLESLSDSEVALLNELEEYARDMFKYINRTFETNGYDYFYEMDEDEVRKMAYANDYEFTEDGELA